MGDKLIDIRKEISTLFLGNEEISVKLNQVVEHESTPQIEGMIRKIQHLVVVERA